jgi:hypothetical protein
MHFDVAASDKNRNNKTRRTTMKRFASSRPHRVQSRLQPRRFRFENLEQRLALAADAVFSPVSSPVDQSLIDDYAQVASGIYYNGQTQELNIHGSELADKVEIAQSSHSVDINTPPMVLTYVTLGHYEDVGGQPTFVVTDSMTVLQPVDHITFWGYGGDDEFRNNSGIDCHVYGGADDDMLVGGAGNNWLDGGIGNDSLYAGDGTTTLNGGGGDDILVSIGGGYATLTGGSGNDSYWMDPTDTLTDASNWEVDNRHVHQVAQFMSYSFDGGQSYTPVSKQLNGQSLADPSSIYAEDEDGNEILLSLQDFSDNPLFASAGPTKNDIFQGSVGDCYLMARISAISDANPDYIQQMVVELGDGTYAVRFYRNGQEVYVRVDADFWIMEGGALRYADLGQDGSIWVAIVEKAFAFFRYELGSYAAIAGGDGYTHEYLGVTQTSWEIQDGVTAEEVVSWYNAGMPSGIIQDTINAGVIELLNWIQGQLDSGKAVTTGARSRIKNSTPIQLDDPTTTDDNESTYRRGQHIYMVDSILHDEDGNPNGLVLRDPYGYNRTLTDFTRIYFCIGRATATNAGPFFPGLYDHIFDFVEVDMIPLPGDPYVETHLPRSSPEFDLARSAAFDDCQVDDFSSVMFDTEPVLLAVAKAVNVDSDWPKIVAEVERSL